VTSPTTIPEQIRLIIVPISNPKTAPYLLRMATALAATRQTRIVALYVALENAEDEGTLVDEFEPIIASFTSENCPVELLTHPASSSVARGILDVAREISADLIILGVQNPRKGEFEIGPVTHAVIAASVCDVMIYASHRDPNFDRIVVPVDGSDHARAACRVALQIADSFHTPMEALLVQRSGHGQFEGRMRLDQSLQGLPTSTRVRRVLVNADDPVSGMLARLREDDLVVIGFASREVLEKWLFSSFSERVLDGVSGPLVLTSSLVTEQNGFARQVQRRLNWARPTLTELEQDALVWLASGMALANLDFFVLAIVAALIASAGLLLNSAAVIIGAMLVAPLMQPLIAFAVGLTTGRSELMRHAVPTVFMGALVALVISFGFGQLVGMKAPTPEMLSRSHPSLLDAAVAVTAGLIAAYATARKDIPAALAGVAIAAALMPPVCTIGLAFAAGEYALAGGASLLFLTNIVFISLAGWAVFFWMGMRPRLVDKSRRRQYISWALVTLLALPILITLLNLSTRESDTSIVSSRLREAFAPAELVDMRVEDGPELQILATIRSAEPITPLKVQIIQNTLSSQLNQPVVLRVVEQTLIQPPTPEERPAPSPTPTSATP
jgi:uncharacterized hydrophobic protein (TIGR00341 family)